MDIIRVLSYGVIGLGFFLALFSYRLLLNEQKMTNPRKSILKAIYGFMGFAIILSLLGLSSELWKGGILKTIAKTTDNNDDSKYYLGTWRGTGYDIVDGIVKDTLMEKYGYDMTMNIREQNDSIIVDGSYTATPMNAWTTPIPVRTFTGCGFRSGDLLRIIYTTKATPQPTGRGLGVDCLRFDPSGVHGEGYALARSLKDGAFVVVKLELNR